MRDFRSAPPTGHIDPRLLESARGLGYEAGDRGEIAVVPPEWSRCMRAWLQGWDDGNQARAARIKSARGAIRLVFDRGD